MAVSTKITKDDKLGEKVMVACAKCGPDRAHVIAATIKEYNERRRLFRMDQSL